MTDTLTQCRYCRRVLIERPGFIWEDEVGFTLCTGGGFHEPYSPPAKALLCLNLGCPNDRLPDKDFCAECDAFDAVVVRVQSACITLMLPSALRRDINRLVVTAKENTLLRQQLETIRTITEAPHWHAERRWKIRDLAHAALAKKEE